MHALRSRNYTTKLTGRKRDPKRNFRSVRRAVPVLWAPEQLLLQPFPSLECPATTLSSGWSVLLLERNHRPELVIFPSSEIPANRLTDRGGSVGIQSGHSQTHIFDRLRSSLRGCKASGSSSRWLFGLVQVETSVPVRWKCFYYIPVL